MVALTKDQWIPHQANQNPTLEGRLRKPRLTVAARPALPQLSAEIEAAEVFPQAVTEPPPEQSENEILGSEEEVEEQVQEPHRREHFHYDGDTPFKLYLREIGQVKLLTPQEEVKLAGRIKLGDRQARDRMITANLRLVVKIARDYEGIGLPLLDLISEGNIGLIKAVERFDPAKGGKLSTYGSWWIKQSIKRALANQSKTIRLPVHVVDKLARMRRASLRLHEELGREPTDEEVSDELGVTPREVALMRQAAVRPGSLDAPIGDEDSHSIGDIVEDETASTPYEQLEEKTVTGMLRDMLTTLDAREITILRARFGLDGEPEQTLEEVGRTCGLTRERVRQLQNTALKRLRKMIEKVGTTKR
jgi:RNA polymerase primary sigma factor